MARKTACDTCAGTGYACPTCKGARWLAQHRDGESSLMVRCHTCGFDTGAGWEYDAYRELQAVERWVQEWVGGLHPYVEKAMPQVAGAFRYEQAQVTPPPAHERYGAAVDPYDPARAVWAAQERK